MSIQHMQMVFDAEGLDHSEKIVLLAYCNYTDAYGYVWAGVPRISDDTGASASTIKRVRKTLRQRGLLATKRRVDPRTGRSTSNITRINLERLAAMKRAPREYDDNVIEELLFTPENDHPRTTSDLRMGQSDPGADLRMGQSDPGSGVNLTPPEGGVNLTPNPSVDPSASSSSEGSADASGHTIPAEEEEELPSAMKKGAVPSSASAAGVVAARLDIDVEEARAVVERLAEEARRRGRPIQAMGRYVNGMALEDLEQRLSAIRRERAPRQPAPSQRQRQVKCDLHWQYTVPCVMCEREIRDPGMRDALEQTLEIQGAEVRPDLVALLAGVNEPVA
ncbi:helix-turn-helix domain-containing protein [Marinactinospora thermotolerans]|uniref:helix-turn-helix domain-containing protein n=1 Tax=Marinactinospora thermotolerans TaxID=531310 RepID=UPI003D8FD113